MKKRIATVSVVLVLACAVIALYMYIDRSGGKTKESVKSAAEKMLSKNLEAYYPSTSHAVAELYCGIVECIYNPETTDKQCKELVKMLRSLYDEEFAAVNPYETYLKTVEEKLKEAKKKKIIFTGYVLDKASNVKEWKNELGSYESYQLQFLLRSEEGSGGSQRELIMRKDKEGKFKIVGWKMAEDGGKDSADTGN